MSQKMKKFFHNMCDVHDDNGIKIIIKIHFFKIKISDVRDKKFLQTRSDFMLFHLLLNLEF